MELLANKVKPITFLLNRFLEKENHFKTPKNSFLIGAGCSISSNIPSGWGVVEICRKITFCKNHSEGYTFCNWNSSNFHEYISQVEAFIASRKNDYERFIKKTEKEFLEELLESEILAKLPHNIIEEITVDRIDVIKKYEKKIHEDSLYGKWFEAFSEDPRERQQLIEQIMSNQKISGEYLHFATLIHNKLIHNIFTTNFDDLINETLISTGVRARVYSHNEVVRFLSIGSMKPNIIKLHGDYLYENIKNTGNETSDLEVNMKTKFKEALSYLDLIVIGYGGADKSIMSNLEELKKERKFRLMWCGQDENNVNWRVKNLINNTKNSYFIKIESFSELVFRLGEISKIKPLDLVENAKENQYRLSEYLDNFSLAVSQSRAISVSEKEKLNNQIVASKYFNKGASESDPKMAIFYLSKAIKYDPTHANAYLYRSLRYCNELKDEDQGLKDLNFALKFEKNNPWIYYNIGVIEEKRKKYDKAIEFYSKALEANTRIKKEGRVPPERIYNNIAVTYRREKDFDKAMEYVNKAIDANPELGNVYGTMALIYADKGEGGDFYKYLEVALEKGCQVWLYLEDRGFDDFRDEEKLIELIEKYKSKN